MIYIRVRKYSHPKPKSSEMLKEIKTLLLSFTAGIAILTLLWNVAGAIFIGPTDYEMKVTSANHTGECLYLNRWVPVKGITWERIVFSLENGKVKSEVPHRSNWNTLIYVDDQYENKQKWVRHEELHGFDIGLSRLDWLDKLNAVPGVGDSRSQVLREYLEHQQNLFPTRSLIVVRVIRNVSEVDFADLNHSSTRHEFSRHEMTQILTPASPTVCDLKTVEVQKNATARYRNPWFGKLQLLKDGTKSLNGSDGRSHAAGYVEFENERRLIGRVF